MSRGTIRPGVGPANLAKRLPPELFTSRPATDSPQRIPCNGFPAPAKSIDEQQSRLRIIHQQDNDEDRAQTASASSSIIVALDTPDVCVRAYVCWPWPCGGRGVKENIRTVFGASRRNNTGPGPGSEYHKSLRHKAAE
jgi:hypothetical protein